MNLTKRIFSVLMALVMMISLASIAVSADATFPVYDASKPNLVIGTANYTGSGTVQVPISIHNNPGVWGLNFQVKYDKSLLQVAMDKDGTHVNVVDPNGYFSNCSGTVDKNGVITLFMDAQGLDSNITNDGVLCYLTFKPLAYESGKTYPVSFTYVDRLSIINISAEDLNKTEKTELTFKNGGVKCAPLATPVFTAGAMSAAKSVRIAWKSVAGATSYKIERSIGTGAWKVLKASTTAVALTDTTATVGGTYTYRVTALNNVTKSAAASKSVLVMSFTDKPTVKKATAGKKQVTVTLKKKITNADGYQYKVGTNQKVTKGTKTSTKSKITGLKKGKQYYVKVRAYKVINGKKVYSNAWSKVVKVKGKVK